MSPDEVVERLSMLGIQVTRRTILNYENWGLIQQAERGGGGTGGRWANYHKAAIAEIYAAWSLIHGQYIKHDLEGLNELFDSKPPKFTPKIISLARGWHIAEVRANDLFDYVHHMPDSDEVEEIINQEIDYGIVDLERMANTEYGKAWARVDEARKECADIISKIPKGGHALIVWVKELWELERNKARILEEQLIKTLE